MNNFINVNDFVNDLTIKTAAAWWTDKIRNRPPHNNGDENSKFAMILSDMLANKDAEKLTDENFNNFEKILYKKIRNDLNKDNLGTCFIICDYNPDILLSEAAEEAGIPKSLFPYKVSMDIIVCNTDWTKNAVLVSDGYAASRTIIFDKFVLTRSLTTSWAAGLGIIPKIGVD